jgi:hypothetical protein
VNGNRQFITESQLFTVACGDKIPESQASKPATQFVGWEFGQQDSGVLVHSLAQERFVEVVTVEMGDVEVVGRTHCRHEFCVKLIVAREREP